MISIMLFNVNSIIKSTLKVTVVIILIFIFASNTIDKYFLDGHKRSLPTYSK